MRGRFHYPQGIYCLSHAIGLLPKSTQHALQTHYFAPWQNASIDTWAHWFSIRKEFHQQLAALLNTEPTLLCSQANVSSALTKIITSKNFNARHILLSEEDFPSLGFALNKSLGSEIQLQFIPRDLDASNPEVWEDALKRYGCDAVLITHVQSNNGRQLPVAAISAIAKQWQATTIVDIAQSVGILPIDLTRWPGVDVVLGSCLKWCCGGPGAGFLWCREEWLEQFEPRDVGWFSHKDPFEFDIHHFHYADDAKRFLGGTPDVASVATAANALKELNTIGIHKVFAHNLQCREQLWSQLGNDYVLSPMETELSGGTVILNGLKTVSEALDRLDVHFDQRADAIRISPHIYNTLNEMTQISEAIVPS